MIAEWRRDAKLLAAIHTLPEALDRAVHCDWSELAAAIHGDSLYTLGRGPSWAIANAAALKFKETCQIHAESYSSAAVLHGRSRSSPADSRRSASPPPTRLKPRSWRSTTRSPRPARQFVISDKVRRARSLPVVRTAHWLTDPIALIVSFYAMVEQVALGRGIDPDAPRHLRKVTETL